MKSSLVALVTGLVALTSPTSWAAFVVHDRIYFGAVNDVHEYYILNDGANGTGTRVASTDVTIVNTDIHNGDLGRGLVFKFIDNTGGAPPDTTGVTLYQSHGNNPAVLFGGNEDRTFVNILGDESTADPTLYAATMTSPDPEFHSNYNLPLYLFEQAGFVSGGVDATAASNGGLGALVAVAVVKHGDPIVASGTVQGTTGPSGFFDLYYPIPEPGAVGLAVCCLAGLLIRGRQR